jgi:signal transduction histidine kinase
MFRNITRLQLIADITFAVVFFLIGFVAMGINNGFDVLLVLAMSIALSVRRFSPGLSLAIAWVGAIMQMSAHLIAPAFADVAVFGVLFAAAAYGSKLVSRLALVSAIVGSVLAVLYIEYLPLLVDSGFFAPNGTTSYLPADDVATIIRDTLILLVACLALLGLSWTLGLLYRVGARGRESRAAQSRAEQDAIVEHERNRIARDMHDVVAHSLAVVIAQADGARYAQASDPEAVTTALTTISATAREALGDVRLLLAQLRHSEEEGPQPVLADIDRLFEQLKASGLSVVREERGMPRPLPAGQQLAIFRIVQEALTNILRHGDISRSATVEFDWSDTEVVLTVTGALRSPAAEGAPARDLPARDLPARDLPGGAIPGAAVPGGAVPGGHGLAGMRERAILAGGIFSADATGGLFVVRAALPVAALPVAPLHREGVTA